MEKHAGGYIGNVPLCNDTQSEWKRSDDILWGTAHLRNMNSALAVDLTKHSLQVYTA